MESDPITLRTTPGLGDQLRLGSSITAIVLLSACAYSFVGTIIWLAPDARLLINFLSSTAILGIIPLFLFSRVTYPGWLLFYFILFFSFSVFAALKALFLGAGDHVVPSIFANLLFLLLGFLYLNSPRRLVIAQRAFGFVLLVFIMTGIAHFLIQKGFLPASYLPPGARELNVRVAGLHTTPLSFSALTVTALFYGIFLIKSHAGSLAFSIASLALLGLSGSRTALLAGLCGLGVAFIWCIYHREPMVVARLFALAGFGALAIFLSLLIAPSLVSSEFSRMAEIVGLATHGSVDTLDSRLSNNLVNYSQLMTSYSNFVFGGFSDFPRPTDSDVATWLFSYGVFFAAGIIALHFSIIYFCFGRLRAPPELMRLRGFVAAAMFSSFIGSVGFGGSMSPQAGTGWLMLLAGAAIRYSQSHRINPSGRHEEYGERSHRGCRRSDL